MAVDPSLALATLKQLIPPGSDYDDPSGDVKLLGLQQQRQDEYAKNLAKQGDGFYPAATPVDLKQASDDIADNPITKQQTFLDAMTKANQTAQAAGFGGDPNSPVAQQRNAVQQTELQKLLLPIQAKTQGDIALEQAKGQQAQQQAAQAHQQAMEIFGKQGGAMGGGDNAPTYQMKPSLNAKGQPSWSSVTIPANIQQQQHSASVGIDSIDRLNSTMDSMEKNGRIGPVEGAAANYMTSPGVVAGTLGKLFMSPEGRQQFNDFKGQIQDLKSTLASTIGTGRAASAQGLMNRYDQIINPTQDPATIRGGLNAFRRWMAAYQQTTNESDKDTLVSLGVEPFLSGAPR